MPVPDGFSFSMQAEISTTMRKTIKFIILGFYLVPHYMIYRLSSQKGMIEADIRATLRTKKQKISFFDYVLAMQDMYFRSIISYRIGFISKVLLFLLPKDITFSIDCESILGGVRAVHSFATIIHAKSIGSNFVFRQSTTIGNKKDGDNSLLPTIGNNVTLGSNVVIIGDIKIGNNVVIGAGSVVVKDVPDDVIVVGNPAKILNK